MSEHGGNVLEMALKIGVTVEEMIDFSANINPLGMPESLKTAIIDQLQCAEYYPDTEYRRLHAALAQAHHCTVENLMAGNGATELIYAVVNYLKPRRAMLLIPGFAEYRRALQRVACQIDEYVMSEADSYQPDERLLMALERHRPDCLFLATPNNPTGLMPDAVLLQAIFERCRQHNIALIVDEAFIDFLPDIAGFIPQIAHFPRLYILRSLTKFFAIPGLRLGYLVSSDVTGIRAMKRWREPWTINAFAALAGEIVLNDNAYIQATHRWLAEQQRWLYQALAALPALRVWPPAANYIFLRCLRPEIDLQQVLLKQRILIRHCANYPGLNAAHYRVAIKGEHDNRRLVSALRQVFGYG
ncbi:threonine-phosphate decarboxylase CobD [Photorhabdus bodei]|uniref:threonine-phosphate decarboxylase n=1 Tax=Photorhabdus bodei TaxID=2029681 RepID=A0A329XH48_9GAMM|nr:threonine-phosphate decarboxylase CobD [Photorhabdus bodei]NDK97662.1 threonine-phosphate decarboxylase [Photorhabdus bodei]NDL01911.1 threonine-phosphate decarboxylase [Photorhabdus bodei]NDL05985.1 threonine-phosphate decarboxylase [Photorhabdus bodei]RAX14188.1 threonine-phosphate decarboxylase [Photorhabdus bodei]